MNVAARMESYGEPGEIQVSEATWSLLREKYEFESRGVLHIKGIGAVRTYLLRCRKGPAAPIAL